MLWQHYNPDYLVVINTYHHLMHTFAGKQSVTKLDWQECRLPSATGNLTNISAIQSNQNITINRKNTGVKWYILWRRWVDASLARVVKKGLHFSRMILWVAAFSIWFCEWHLYRSHKESNKKNIATGETSPAITPYHTYHFSISTFLTIITSKLPSHDDFHHLITLTTR